MAEAPRETWITGVGIVSSLGEGPDAHWQALDAGKVHVEAKTFAPYIVHPLAPVNFDAQIPQKRAERLGRMDMIVPAGGGERDLAADGAILSGLPKAGKQELFLNERLMNDLR